MVKRWVYFRLKRYARLAAVHYRAQFEAGCKKNEIISATPFGQFERRSIDVRMFALLYQGGHNEVSVLLCIVHAFAKVHFAKFGFFCSDCNAMLYTVFLNAFCTLSKCRMHKTLHFLQIHFARGLHCSGCKCNA